LETLQPASRWLSNTYAWQPKAASSNATTASTVPFARYSYLPVLNGIVFPQMIPNPRQSPGLHQCLCLSTRMAIEAQARTFGGLCPPYIVEDAMSASLSCSCKRKVILRLAQNADGRRSAIEGYVTRHPWSCR
jgi:hypothetical protein